MVELGIKIWTPKCMCFATGLPMRAPLHRKSHRSGASHSPSSTSCTFSAWCLETHDWWSIGLPSTYTLETRYCQDLEPVAAQSAPASARQAAPPRQLLHSEYAHLLVCSKHVSETCSGFWSTLPCCSWAVSGPTVTLGSHWPQFHCLGRWLPLLGPPPDLILFVPHGLNFKSHYTKHILHIW